MSNETDKCQSLFKENVQLLNETNKLPYLLKNYRKSEAVPGSGKSFCIAIYNILGPWCQGRKTHFALQSTICWSCPTLAPGSDKSFCIANYMYNMFEFFDPGTRVGKIILHCNLQYVGVARPWRQGRTSHCVLPFERC